MSMWLKRFKTFLILTCCFCTPTTVWAVQSDPIAQWEFDEGQGKVARDSSGNGRDATLYGAQWVKTSNGFSMSFTQPGDSVVFRSTSKPLGITGAVTLAAWVKPMAETQELTMFLGGGDLSSCQLALYSKDSCYWYVGGASSAIAMQVKLNEWNHIVATFDGKTSALYLDGKLIATGTPDPSTHDPLDTLIMGSSNANLPQFKGEIDSVRVYNRALAADEIKALRNAGASEHGVVLPPKISRATRQSSTDFFHNHPNEIDVAEQGGSLLFANRQVGLEFQKSSVGFELTRLYGISENQEFLTAPDEHEARNLFEIRMTDDPRMHPANRIHQTEPGGIAVIERMAQSGNPVTIGSQSAKSVSWREERGEDQTTLHLVWNGIDVKGGKEVLTFEVTVTLQAGDPITYWRFALQNSSPYYGVERVTLPILPLAPIGDAVENVFIYPKWRGGYAENPFNAPRGFGENYHTQGAWYPYYTQMQFWALYNRSSNHGLYFGTQDPTPNISHIKVDNTPTQILWSVSHFPPNLSYSNEDFVLPYDSIVGPFQGDWYDACQLYRDWALQQTWCRKGPLAIREDIPTWYKECPFVLTAQPCDSITGTHSTEQNQALAADNFRQWLDWSNGLKLPVDWYSWQQYTPGMSRAYDTPTANARWPHTSERWGGLRSGHNAYDNNYPAIPAQAEFVSETKRLRPIGGMVKPYVCLQLLNQGPLENAPYADEGRDYMARDTYGALLTYPGLGEWLPCVSTPWWQNRLVEVTTGLVEHDYVGGIYLDVMHGMGMPCFWTPHGHSAAGGSSATIGMHDLAEKIRDAIKAIDPEVITTGENAAENMIDVIDGTMLQRTLWPENKVPLFATVYQEYLPRSGCYLLTPNAAPHGAFVEIASLFLEGAQVGRLNMRPRGSLLSFDNPQHQEMFRFLEQIRDYYKQEQAKQFLVYGQLVRPIDFVTPSPLPMLDHVNDRGVAAQFPALMSGVFRAEDGELGVFLANAGGENLAFQIDLDLMRYGAATDAIGSIEHISPDGSSTPVTYDQGEAISLKGDLAEHSIMMYRIKLKPGQTWTKPLPASARLGVSPTPPLAAPAKVNDETLPESRYQIPYRP